MGKRFSVKDNGEVQINKINFELLDANEITLDDNRGMLNNNEKIKNINSWIIQDLNGEIDTVAAAEYILRDKDSIGWSFIGI